MDAGLKTIRSDHTGALRRPEWLNDLYARLGEGAASVDEVAAGQGRAVREVIEKQQALGLPVVTDGEFCRIGGFQESFGGAVSGSMRCRTCTGDAQSRRPPAPPPGPLDQVALCPRCGFGSADEAVQWGKFAVMQQVAGEVWG